MTNEQTLNIASKAAFNFLIHNREDYVLIILKEQYNLSNPQAVEAIKIAKKFK